MENETQNPESTFSKAEFNSYVKSALEQVKKRTRFSSRIASQRAQKENAIIDV